MPRRVDGGSAVDRAERLGCVDLADGREDHQHAARDDCYA